MIREVFARDFEAHAALVDEMFQARRRLFRERLEWDVSVDANGWEIDEYDALDPIYLISVDEAGHHLGSLRMLPTTGRTMLAEHFTDLLDGQRLESPEIWECTRFCVEADARNNLMPTGVRRVTIELLLALCEMGLKLNARHVVGVFDPRMIRIYRRSGWQPHVLAESGTGRDAVYLGLWDVTEEHRDVMREVGGFHDGVIGGLPPRGRADRIGAA